MQQTATNRSVRISSIDLLRGAIMLIMALDHVRDYFHSRAMLDQPTNLATTTAALFFTRWITHFCAPIFVFLSGMSVFISGQRKTKSELSLFLIKRGLWLVLADIFIMTLIETFNPAYNLLFLAVLWVIGWSMVLLGLFIRASYTWIAVVGILIIAGHNLTDYLPLPAAGPAAAWWQLLLTSRGSVFNIGFNRVAIAPYAILPWTAIMFIGYAVGHLYKTGINPIRRKKMLFTTGTGLIILFIILRYINVYGDPAPWAVQRDNLFTFLSFLNVTKYPFSLQFTLMTLGPAMIFLSMTETSSNQLINYISTYGRVPFFYFMVHFLVIHLLCTLAFFATGYSFSQAADPASPFLFRPARFGFSLLVVYAVWLLVISIMYYPCRWYSRYKRKHQHGWLSYV